MIESKKNIINFNKKEYKGVIARISKEKQIHFLTVKSKLESGDEEILNLVEKYALENIEKEKANKEKSILRQQEIVQNIEKAKQGL